MDPTNCFESRAFVNANQLEQTETISCMDRNSYYAAAEGKIVVFKDITDQSLDLLLSPNEKKVLHIYIKTLNSGSESTNQPSSSNESQTETFTCMSCDYYNAAAEGNIDFFKPITKESLELLCTPNKNTILHIYITALNSISEYTTNFVEEILKKCSSLVWQANAKGETPLHIAARYGHSNIVKVLMKYCAKTPCDQDPEGGIDSIERVKEMLRMTNKEKDTALHEAVRYNHLKVVELLIEGDPNFSYYANDAGETPLYIAVERNYESVLSEILAKCKSPMHGGPLGRTALHAAVIRNEKGITEILLKKIEGITREVDSNGWTPLHFAAYLDRSGAVELLLNKDQYDRSNNTIPVSEPYTAYMKNKEGMTPLHIAAQHGHVGIVKSIVLRCPDCCELVDNKGWNVLHYAMKAYSPDNVIGFLVENSSLSNLLNEKNDDGDTPLHFYSNSQAIAINFVNHPRVDKMAFNKNNLSAYELASTNSKLQVKKLLGCRYAQPLREITCEDDTSKLENQEGKAQLQKIADNSLVVATLITTVTFAACITMPGGFGGEEGSHPGSALLRKNTAFKAFIITDTISMALSSSAVFISLWSPTCLNLDAEDRDYLLSLSLKFIIWAIVAMGLAFVTGTYAVLAPSLNLAIANCIFGLIFFAFLFHVCRKFIWSLTKRLNRVTNVKYM